MEKFLISVEQEQIVNYEGTLEVEAETKEEALKIAKEMSQLELEKGAKDWSANFDNTRTYGDIIIIE